MSDVEDNESFLEERSGRFQRSAFFLEDTKPLIRKGVRYVYLWNSAPPEDESSFYRFYLKIRRVNRIKLILRRVAYPSAARGPEDRISGFAVFVAESDVAEFRRLSDLEVKRQVG